MDIVSNNEVDFVVDHNIVPMHIDRYCQKAT